MQEENADPSEAAVIAKARNVLSATAPGDVGTVMSFVLIWLSELGKKKELDGLLEYIDSRNNRTWENGGLFYKRSDSSIDEEGNVAKITPLTGNACVAYSRLNVPNGQKIMWDNPWTKEQLASKPWIDGVDLSQGVDCLRGVWDADESALILTVRSWNGETNRIRPIARNLAEGAWAVYVKGELVTMVSSVGPGGALAVEVKVGDEDVDVIFQQIQSGGIVW